MGETAQVLRTRMVNNQLRTFDVTDHRVQDAVLAVERTRFVPASERALAYSDEAIAISRNAAGQPLRTMTRPAIFGRLLQLANVRSENLVLLVGAGLGYGAAVIGQLSDSVIALECDADLADAATTNLTDENVTNAVVVTGELPAGYAGEGPYDVIFVDGAIEVEPTALLDQLRDGGRLVAIEGGGLSGRSIVYSRAGDSISPRRGFNAAADILPGFSREEAFVF